MKRELEPGFSFAADAVVIGTSAGGIDALLTLFDGLQAPMQAAIIVVLHLPEDHESRLVQVFASRVRVPVREAQPNAAVEPGMIFFAPSGYHLLVERERSFSLSCDPPVQFSRPSIDVLFDSCAEAYGPSLAGLVLTGANEDGARGLARIKACGGLAAVQDPQQAAHSTMPQAAVQAADPDYVLPLAGLRRLLHTVVRR
jgi:two-component system, chemotaxis family, protein-glutamate methylesterase/glutaminase